jgi:hypothetical protein
VVFAEKSESAPCFFAENNQLTVQYVLRITEQHWDDEWYLRNNAGLYTENNWTITRYFQRIKNERRDFCDINRTILRYFLSAAIMNSDTI